MGAAMGEGQLPAGKMVGAGGLGWRSWPAGVGRGGGWGGRNVLQSVGRTAWPPQESLYDVWLQAAGANRCRCEHGTVVGACAHTISLVLDM